ncbi:MAG: HAD-IIA family hydrolase [Actinomycetota bacterium]
MTSVAVVGLGAMGSRIAARLVDVGHEVLVWNRTAERAAPLVETGAVHVATPADAARRAEVVLTMVADQPALAAVTEGPAGVAAGARPSSIVVEMSTVGPDAVARLASLLPAGVALVDAPVLGSVTEAESGMLTLFVGGPAAIVERVGPLLTALGTPMHVGPLGTGAAAKLVANSTLFGTLGTLGEAVALARGLGLSPEATFGVLAATPLAAQAERRRPAIETGEFPPRFPLDLARKDARLIHDAARAAGVELRLASAAETWLAQAQQAGLGSKDYTAMLSTIMGPPPDPPRPPSARRGPGDHDGLIVDLDGVVWRGPDPIDGAVEAIATVRAMGVRVMFLTNEPGSSRSAVAERLTGMGVPATADDVVTSGAATARVVGALEGLPARAALVVGPPALREEIAGAGFRLVSPEDALQASVVVVGGHPGFGYAELAAATSALRHGARLFAAGRDAVFPTHEGPRPGTGAILAAVETAGGVPAVVVGKPEPIVFEIARESLPGCERVAVVGDHLVSDIEGARRAGLGAILVLTGTTGRAELERATIRPDLVLDSLADLPAAMAASR